MRSRSIASPSKASSFRSPGAPLSEAALLKRRQTNFRQRRDLRVRSEKDALDFVNAVGFCSTFHVIADGPASLWEAVVGRPKPRWPRRSHHDAGVGLTWELKNVLPHRRLVYYGKLVKARPMLVALDVFPAFYALVRGSQTARDYVREYHAGRLTVTGKRIMDSLMREFPQYTRSLRAECFMLEPSKTREFERAMAELQQGLWIVKTEERYEPTFSYRWDLLERWLPEPAAEGRRLRRSAALDHLLTRYLRAAVYATPAGLARLFAVPRADVDVALTRLARTDAVSAPVEIAGRAGRFVVSV